MMKNQDVLIRNGFIAIPSDGLNEAPARNAEQATILSNLAYYGYTLDHQALDVLMRTPLPTLAQWWVGTKTALAAITGDDRDMGAYMVYKNFPREVLNMSETTYVFRQIMIYLGLPYDYVREEEQPREPLGDMKRLKVLALADETAPKRILDNLVASTTRWTDNQNIWVDDLYDGRAIVVSEFGFKENALALAAKQFGKALIAIDDATDVLRLAAALSDGDISLRQTVKFRAFKRPERRVLLALLEGTKNIEADMALRPEPFKRLLQRLRPGDYEFAAKTRAAYDSLYNRKVKSFAALVDPRQPTIETLDVAATRPGELLRRFHHFYELFGTDVVTKMIDVLPRLKTRQLVNFRAYLRTINDRSKLIYPPKSNWARAQVAENTKRKLAPSDLARLEASLKATLAERMRGIVPEGFALDPSAALVKLPTNDQKLAEYGRGTVFDIPAEMTFARTASFWKAEGYGVTWYDNGWNFFDENWQPKGACSWNDSMMGGSKAAVFSGDPVNVSNLEGKACQMIDLYFDRLVEQGVRYCVWNILCYSRKKFSEATEVLATLQLGEKAEKGKVYEPSRAQMVFPLKSETYTSYVAYIDLHERKLVYMDAPLRGNVSCAGANSDKLAEVMPAYVEYLESLPTVADLVDAHEGSVPVLYTDAGTTIETDKAFVFRPENPENTFQKITVADLLAA